MDGEEMARVAAVVSCFLLVITTAGCFYLPGVSPSDYCRGDIIQVKVKELSSTKTQLPYDFYYLSYCRPVNIRYVAGSLGEFLRGDRTKNSVYTFRMREDEDCKVACRIVLDAQGAKDFKDKIDDEYRTNMILDNLPVAARGLSLDTSSISYEQGFHVGFRGNHAGSQVYKYFLNNHLSFTVMYHRDPETESARVVGFEVAPRSIKHEFDKNMKVSTCNHNTRNISQETGPLQEVNTGEDIIFSYDVTFKESEMKWTSRWDTYLLMNGNQIHWFSIINSLLILFLLSGMVAMIMIKTLCKDIASYNQLETKEEAGEETGWKLVHGDVFRPPENSELLCVYAGTGVQILGMTLMTTIFLLLGFLSPFNSRGIMTTMALAWSFMGCYGGYSSARLYKMFNGTEWMRNAFKTAILVPGVIFVVFLVLNALIWGKSLYWAVVPLGRILALAFLWFGISVPLVFVGGYFGFKKIVIQDPTNTYKIPRQIPQQPWYLRPIFTILIGGILPFGVVFIELFFILSSIWLNQFYYVFVFLLVDLVILMIVCAEITIVLCYFQLCSEDYNWWWRAYLTAGSSAFYLFLYSVFYFFTSLDIAKEVSTIMYFGYMLIMSCAFFMLTGTIGFYACFWFVRRIYSSVKID